MNFLNFNFNFISMRVSRKFTLRGNKFLHAKIYDVVHRYLRCFKSLFFLLGKFFFLIILLRNAIMSSTELSSVTSQTDMLSCVALSYQCQQNLLNRLENWHAFPLNFHICSTRMFSPNVFHNASLFIEHINFHVHL